jgi:hypothetical protein
VGLVQSVREEERRQLKGVQRIIAVEGSDFSLIFDTYAYYNLNLLLGLDTGALGALGLPSQIDGALQGAPDQVAEAWFTKIMNALMAKTSFYYSGSRVTFPTIMASLFEAYPAPLDIPTMAPFIGDEGSWTTKFKTFLPFPWYDFFIMTAQSGDYSGVKAAGTAIRMDGFPPVSPTVVARVNPLPFLEATDDPESPTFSMDLTRWYALTNYTLDTGGYFSDMTDYSDAEVRNFYVFAPTWLSSQFGNSNGSISPFQLLFAAWLDSGSLQRYGYRPQVSEVRWMADTTGSYAEGLAGEGKGLPDMQALVSTLALRPVSYYEPTTNMKRGSVQMELRPDIVPGNRFTFAPRSRDGNLWTFYIEGIEHNVTFGGRSMTSLSLGRGLPAGLYSDQKTLIALHTGNAERKDGVFQIGLPTGIGPGLKPLNVQTQAGLLSGLSDLFAAPRN